jgi:NADH-quinone oxidoreductase subunit A
MCRVTEGHAAHPDMAHIRFDSGRRLARLGARWNLKGIGGWRNRTLGCEFAASEERRIPHPPLAMLVVYCVAVVILVVAMVALGFVLGPRHFAAATPQPFEFGVVPVGDARVRFPVQFCLIAMFCVVFDVEAVFIYAWTVAAREARWAGYAKVLVFIAILLAALLYCGG